MPEVRLHVIPGEVANSQSEAQEQNARQFSLVFLLRLFIELAVHCPFLCMCIYFLMLPDKGSIALWKIVLQSGDESSVKT